MPSEKRDGEIFVGVWLEIRDALKEISSEALIAELRSREALPAITEKKEHPEPVVEKTGDGRTMDVPEEQDNDDDIFSRRDTEVRFAHIDTLQMQLAERFLYDEKGRHRQMELGAIIEYESLQEQQAYEAFEDLLEKFGSKKMLDILSSL